MTENNLGQNDFADLFDLKVTTARTYISGRSAPKLELIVEIADYFKVSIDDLIRGDLQKKKYLSEGPEGLYNTAVVIEKAVDQLNDKIDLQKEIIQAKDDNIKSLENNIKTLQETVQILKSTNDILSGKAAS